MMTLYRELCAKETTQTQDGIRHPPYHSATLRNPDMDPRVKEVKDAAKKRNKELLSKAFKEVVGSQLEKVKQQLSSRTSGLFMCFIISL